MDTIGRTTLTLTAMNVIDESRDTELIVSPLNSPPLHCPKSPYPSSTQTMQL